ncbi:TetR/AcrR family transcriptional regulator [Bacillus timonensis]|uniref:TetR/AcrR family transcriptional regulator n=1 Tax=Bacillus timonensis TaxID=1033734 RepID=A0A4S3PSG9_9BACI|nr:TetR/AcrR family transcriptional regulator [Bacillus timonensis]THE12236.1 TetR/AcrR family transcriptional regulator [Bacillus timonensis]
MTKDNLLDAIIEQTKTSKKPTEKQQKIAETAIKMFADKGYANTSTSEIAKAAGVAEGTIFRHYGTKDNLLLSVIIPFLKEALPGMAGKVFKEVLTEDTVHFEDFLRRIIKNRMEFILENQEIFRIIVKELLYSEELRKEFLPYFSTNVMRRVAHAIELFKSRGEIKDLPTDALLKMLMITFGGFLVTNFVLSPSHNTLDIEQETENLVRFVMDGIRN